MAFWSRCKILACKVGACTERKISFLSPNFWGGLKVTQQSWLLLFVFSPPLLLCFSCLGFILVGKVFGKAFRILGLDERKGRWAVEQDFHGNFQVNVTWFFAFFSGVIDWIVLILVWFERSLHSAQVSAQSCPRPLKLMKSQAVERTWIRTGVTGSSEANGLITLYLQQNWQN